MIAEVPFWAITVPIVSDNEFIFAILTERYAVGQWFCVERTTGQVLWTEIPRCLGGEIYSSEDLVGVHDDVLVVSQVKLVDDGHFSGWYSEDYLYGVSLTTRKKCWRKRLRSPDYKPSFREDMALFLGLSRRRNWAIWTLHKSTINNVPMPSIRALWVDGDGIQCDDGTLLSSLTGDVVGHQPIENLWSEKTRIGWIPAAIKRTNWEQTEATAEDARGRLVLSREDDTFYLTYFSRSVEA